MRLLVFSDGHIGEYAEGFIDPETGLNSRLLDTLRIWDWIKELALENKVDAVLFLGDRFKPNRPPSWMRDLADQKVNDMKNAGLRIALLLGNHDMFDKGGRWNSYGGIVVWNEYSNILVFDQPGSIKFDEFQLYFLPFGYREIDYASLDPYGNNILLFHDEVKNISQYNRITATKGLDKEIIDREEFRLVLGGHIHERQRLNLNNTIGYHVGTPLQRVQDSPQRKGAFLIDITKDDLKVKFIESPFPKIVRLNFFVENSEIDFENLSPTVVSGNILQVEVSVINNRPPSGLRKTILSKLKENGAAGANIRVMTYREELNTELGNTVFLDLETANLPTPQQILAWATIRGETDDQLEYLKRVLESERN